MLPTLRITFNELEERSKLLERTKTVSKHTVSRKVEDSKETSVQISLEGRGVLHLKPTVIPEPTNRGDKKRSSKSHDKSQHVNSLSSSVQEKLVRQGIRTDPSRYLPSSSPGGNGVLYPVMQENQTGFAEQRSKSMGNRKRKEEVKVAEKEMVARSSRSLRSKSTPDWPQRGYDNVKIELRELIEEWDCLESRKVERTLARWNGDVAKLNPIFETW